jgi:hypothetical protein
MVVAGMTAALTIAVVAGIVMVIEVVTVAATMVVGVVAMVRLPFPCAQP